MENVSTFGFNDCLWCKLCVRGTKLIVGVCYRSPASSSVNDEGQLSMFNSVGDLADTNTCIVVMGDLDLPNIDFRTSCVHVASDSFAGRVFDCLIDIWKQHATDFTRIRDNQAPSCLYWVIMVEADIVEELLTYKEPLGKSDHSLHSIDTSSFLSI